MGENGIMEVVEYTISLSGRSVDDLAAEKGKIKFAACVACHGSDGKGNQNFGAPNLTDDIWLYGGSTKSVIKTVSDGRSGLMPSFKDTLGEEKVHILAAYVYRLSNWVQPVPQ